jgi:peroxisomal enoyl-CoA hydratase 2
MKPDKVIPSQVRGYKLEETEHTYTEIQTMLYAIGVGVSRDPMNLADLNFTYENAENFKVLPTFGVTIGKINKTFEALTSCPGMPVFNPMMLLHGEQKLEMFKPFPPSQKLTLRGEISDVADKGKGALVTISSSVFDQQNQIICRNTSKLFIRGIGGFGDKGLTNDVLAAVPKTPPQKVSEDETRPNQAILYRLAGDLNPLHIAPDMAALGGFDRPILHGLCFFGVAGRAVLKEFCADDVSMFKSISARFTSHVFPGETLITEMWRNEKGVVFQQKTKERGKVCCQGFVEIGQATPKI